jgi:hypothetical protein
LRRSWHLDAIGVAECRPGRGRILEVHQHVDALLLDAERRDLHEAGRLHAPNACSQRRLAAPLNDLHGLARGHPDGVAGEQVRHDLEPARIAHLEQRLSGGHDRLALPVPLQHDAVDRRAYDDRARRCAGGA